MIIRHTHKNPDGWTIILTVVWASIRYIPLEFKEISRYTDEYIKYYCESQYIVWAFANEHHFIIEEE